MHHASGAKQIRWSAPGTDHVYYMICIFKECRRQSNMQYNTIKINERSGLCFN